jgi:hypothetical protein
MDKKIVDKLIQFGLITNVGVDANKYTDVDDLIAKGIVTVPGAKAKIMELIGDDSIVIEELPTEDAVVVETPTEETPTEEEVVVEEAVEDATPETAVVEEAAEAEVVEEEVVVEETTAEEAPAKSEKKSGKSSKND